MGEAQEYSEKNLCQCHIVNNKTYTDHPGTEPRPTRW